MTEVRGRKSEVRSQRSEDRGQKTEIRGQRSEDRGDEEVGPGVVPIQREYVAARKKSSEKKL